jgi:cytochrome c biogenesis protein CcmG/thiol:disulfide interchange protein DsbE
MKRVIPLLVFVVFAAMATVLLLHAKPTAPHSASFVMPSLELVTRENEPHQLVLDNGVVVVNFFASWCAPCLAEHQELITLKKRFPQVTFHGIAWNDTAEKISAMLKEHGNPYDATWLDNSGSSAIALGLRGVPESFIVKEGRVIYHVAGPITASIRSSEIEPLLAQ